ncbi:hypothetical protein [Gimesia maris]|uniref:hypothetical protein n=1 Tax=Gimesia maris TaxID=122 RepID=UPI0032EB3D8A
MNITEEQVREVLEKHGMGGWSTYSDSEKLILMPGAPRQPISLVASANGAALIEDLQIHAASKDYEATWHSHVYPAIRDLITLLSEPTLQERVEEILHEARHSISVPKVVYAGPDRVELKYNNGGIHTVYPDGTASKVNEFVSSDFHRKKIDDATNWTGSYRNVLHEIVKVFPSPSLESQIAEQQRVIEGLRAELKTEGDKWAQSFKILKDKNLALEEQLQGCVSQADHEREMDEWETLYESEIGRRNRNIKRLDSTLKKVTESLDFYQTAFTEQYKLRLELTQKLKAETVQS